MKSKNTIRFMAVLISLVIVWCFGITVFAATVGQALVNPEAGWTRYDDSDSRILYGTGVTKKQNDSRFYNNTSTQLNTDPSTSWLKFKFSGTKLRIIGCPTNICDTQCNISIDGVNYTFNASTPYFQYYTLQFEITDLVNTMHTVDIFPHSGKYLVLDAIDIDETGALLDPQTLTAPSSLNATAGDGLVDLAWDAVADATGYNIKRATTAGGPYTTIAESITEAAYTDTSVLNDTTYYYIVTAVNGVGESDNSNEVSVTPQAILPNSPTNLIVVPGNAQVALSWSAVPDATGYNVKRSEAAGGPYTAIAENITETAYTDTTVTNGMTYYYVVTAVTAGGESDPSAEVSATPAVSISAPANVTAVAGDGQVTLSWSVVDGATGYNIKCATTAGGPYTVIASNLNATNYTDTNALNNVTYYYVVSAVTVEGESPDSFEVSAMPVHVGASRFILEITLSNGQHKEYDMSDTELNAFLAWFDSISQGTGSRFYIIEKTYGMGPYASRKDYLIYDKVLCFEINEYYI